MPTLSQLKKKFTKHECIKEIENIGFILGPDRFWFYRWRGEYLDVVSFWLKSSGEWMQVPVVCFTKEMVGHCDMSRFPKGFSKDMPSPTGQFIGNRRLELVGGAIDVSDDKKIENAIRHIAKVIVNEVDPWFKGITTREALFNSLSPRNREGVKGEAYRRLLGLT